MEIDPPWPDVNWPALLDDLRARGWTQTALVAHLNAIGVPCAQSTISDLSRGAIKHPGYPIGRALEHLDSLGKRVEELEAVVRGLRASAFRVR